MQTNALTNFDWSIILVYLTFIVILGSYFGKRQNSERFFLGKRTLPGWAVGISMFATIISSWAFIALPGKGFKDGLQHLMIISTLPITTIIASAFFIPLFRDKIRLSAYEYLERRFGLLARVYGNLAFLIVHFGKMGAILYLLCMALSQVTGWDIYLLIAIIGTATMVYTFFGGIEGVVWSDVVQGILLLAGGLISLIYLATALGGPMVIKQLASDSDRFRLLVLDFDWRNVNTYVLMCFGLNYYLQKYVSDQTVVQRYLLSPSKKQAARALWISTLCIMLVWLIFMTIGVLLWFYFNAYLYNSSLTASMSPDGIFPYFIGHVLPSGISGLIIAALLAATMSTLSSDLNSLSAVLFDDYYSRFRAESTDQQKLLFSRFTVLIAGLLAVVLAMWMTKIQSMADAAFNFVSLVAGGVLGMYLLGIFTKRCSRKGLHLGLIVAVLFIMWAYLSGANRLLSATRIEFPAHQLWIGLFGNIIVLAVGYLASLLLSPKHRAEAELTVFKQ